MMFAACMRLCKGDFKRRILALSVTVALTLAAVAIVLVAIGFGLSLLYVWLQQLYGSMPALAIIAGGCVALGLTLFLIVFFRRTPRPIHREAAGSERMIASGEHAIDEAGQRRATRFKGNDAGGAIAGGRGRRRSRPQALSRLRP